MIAPRLALERADVPHIMDSRFPAPYSNYTPAVLAPEDDLLAEWEVFAGVAARNGTSIELAGGPIPFEDGRVAAHVDDDTILDLAYARSRMPMAEIRASRGVVHDARRVVVVEADPDDAGRFHLAPADVVAELGEVAAARAPGPTVGDEYPFHLVSRRMKHVVNSLGPELPGLAAVGTTNPAYLHPTDLAALGVRPGELVRIESPHGEVLAVAAAGDDVRPGVVSMSHAWGRGTRGDGDVRAGGMPTNRLVSAAVGFDPVTGMAVQSAVPVRVSPVDGR